MGADGTVKLGWDDAELQAGAKRSERAVKGFEKKTKESFKDLAGLGAGAFTTTFMAGAAGLRMLGNEFDRVGELAQQLGEDAESVQRLGAMAKLSASDVEGVVKALHRVNKGLASGEGAEVFQKLGISVREYLSLRADEQVILLAKAFQTAEQSGRGLKEANDLFGKSHAELLPLLRTNVESLREMSQIKVVTSEDVQAIQEMNDAIDMMGMNLKAMTAQGLMDAVRGVQQMGTALSLAISGTGSYAEALEVLRQAQARGREEHERALEALRKQRAETRAKVIEDEAAARAAEELAKAEKEAAAEREKARRKAEDEAKERQKRMQSLQDLKAEMDILKLMAAGKDEAAAKALREQRIKQDARRIVEQTGMAEKAALKIAREKVELEEKAQKRQDRGEGGRRRIQGYKRSQGAVRGFGGLDEFDRNQEYTSDTGPGGRALRVHPAFNRGGDSMSFRVLPPGSRERARNEARTQQEAAAAKQSATEGTQQQMLEELRKLNSL